MSEGTKVSAGNKGQVQVRKERKDAFNAAKKQTFPDHLAACCAVRSIRRSFVPTYRELCHLRAAALAGGF